MLKQTTSVMISELKAGHITYDVAAIHSASTHSQEPLLLDTEALILAAGTEFNFETLEQEVHVTLIDSKRNKESFLLIPENATQFVSQSLTIFPENF